MNSISSLISILSTDDKKKFLSTIDQKNKRNDVKNIRLFKLLDTDKDINDIDQVLYGKPSKGAYHALSKRLHDSLIDYIATKGFEKESSIEMNALKLVLASRIFFKHKLNKIAFKTLQKADHIAIKHSLYSILNESYHTQIMHAHLNDSLDLNKLIIKFKKNKQNIQKEEDLNFFYATLQKELSKGNIVFTQVIQANLKSFDISISDSLSYQSLFKILEISNKVAHLTRDYYAILDFVEDACSQIETSERIEDKHLNEHIQILYYLANTNFRIKNFKKATSYIQNMNSYMKLNDKKHFDTYFPQYFLVLNLIEIFKGNAELASKNLSLFNYEKYSKEQEYVHNLKLIWVVSLVFEERYKEAFSIYRNFYRNDKWYAEHYGNIWVIKKNLIELLTLIELNHFDLFESRLISFKKKHSKYLIKRNEKRVLDFLKFISAYYYRTEDFNSEEFKSKIENALKIKDHTEDIFILCFYSWLMAKINGTTTYQTCLDYINHK